METNKNSSQEYKQLQHRPYQSDALKVMRNFTKKWINDAIETPNDFGWNSVLSMHMATGAGKTATSGTHIKNIFNGRDALERMKGSNIPLKILVLNDRTTLVNQLYEANIQGKGGYAPLFGQDILDHAHVKVIHSKADTTKVINSQNEIIEIEGNDIDREVGKGKKDTVYFSTFQSANKFSDEGMMFDVIMIDEAHHLNASTYHSVVQEYVDRYESYHGRQPLIMPMSATLGDMFGDPIVNYGLPEYLAGPYSPEVDYHLVTSSDFSDQDLEQVNTEIQRIQDIADIREKIKAIKDLKEYIQDHLAQFGGLKELTQDMISRILENAGSLDHTILFASSIDEVDLITQQINEIMGENTAVGFHSKIDEADYAILQGYESGKYKIIVAVDKLNEGIDLPATRNVVFRRGTESSIIFQQQFGRGLRGDQVSFYDYTGMMRNFAWIGDINQQINTIKDNSTLDEEEDSSNKDIAPKPRKGIDVLIGDINSNGSNNIRQIQLDELVRGIDRLDSIKDFNDMTKEECINYLKNQLLSQHNITSSSQLFAFGPKKFRKEFGLSLIGTILGRTLYKLSLSDLEELATVLDLPPFDPKQELITQLSQHNITSSTQLIAFGAMRFQKEFGLSLIGTILGRTLKKVLVSDIEELAQVLDLPKISEQQKEDFRGQLATNVPPITSSFQLITLGINRFKKEFGLSLIGTILGRTLYKLSLSDLEELATVLDLPPFDPKQELITQLSQHNITSSTQLIAFGARRFKKEFGVSLIGRILGKIIKQVSPSDIKELCNKLYEDH